MRSWLWAMIVGALGSVAVVGGADPALATSQVTRHGDVLTFTASPGVANDVTVSVEGATLILADAADTPTADPSTGCVASDASSIACPLAGLTRLVLELGDLNDVSTKDTAVPIVVEHHGGDHNDRLVAAGGAGSDGIDRYEGGSGTDFVSYGLRTGAVVVDNDGVADDGAAGEGDHIGTDVEGLFGGQGNDTVTGGPGNDWLGGGPGDDVVSGGAGNDNLVENLGNDVNNGGDGNDWLTSTVGADGADAFHGGDGVDIVSFNPRSIPVSVSADGVADDGGDGEGDNVHADVETIVGGSGDDVLSGGTVPNTIIGGGGDDVFPTPTLDGPDTYRGGGGTDTVTYESRTGTVTADADDQPDDGETDEGDNVASDVEVIVLPEPAPPARCPGLENQPGNHIVGSPGNDLLIGTDGADVICGFDGNDAIDGHAGADVLSGGAGDDVLIGGPGDDGFAPSLGPDGADDITGGDGYDTMSYAARFDSVVVDLDGVGDDGGALGLEGDNVRPDIEQLIGGLDHDVLTGGPLANRVVGGAGDDLFLSPTTDGADGYVGGAGNDLLSYAGRASAVIVDLDGEADDGAAGEHDNAGFDIERVTGGSANDRLSGGLGANVLAGGPGDDRFLSPTVDAADVYRGGPGVDTLDYFGRTSGVVVDLDGVTDDGAPGEGDDAGADIENLVGTTHADVLTGNGGDNVLRGGFGDDELRGGDGDDVFLALRVSDGADVIDGGFGVDTASYATRRSDVAVSINDSANDGADAGLEGDNVRSNVENVAGGLGNDSIRTGGCCAALENRFVGGAGHDDLDGGPGDDVLDGGQDDDVLHGGTGEDVVVGGDGFDSLHGGFNADELDGGRGADFLGGDEPSDSFGSPDVLGGGSGDDFIVGGGGDDRVDGGPGDDVLEAGADDDSVDGGSGNDRIWIVAEVDGDDDYHGGPGRDLVSYAVRKIHVWISVDDAADDGTFGQNSNDRTEFDNVHTDVELVDGGEGNDVLRGSIFYGTYRNEMYGLGGHDSIVGPARGFVDGGDGNDSLHAGGGRVELHGGAGDDYIEGNHERNWLYGDAGRDDLFAHDGNDFLDGGDGVDHLNGGLGIDTCAGEPWPGEALYCER